jgi:hypothetical protein
MGGHVGGLSHVGGFGHGGFSHVGGFGHGGFSGGGFRHFGHGGFDHDRFHGHSNFFFGIDVGFGYPLYDPFYYPYYPYYSYPYPYPYAIPDPYYVDPPVYMAPAPAYVPAPPRRDYRSGDDDYYLYRRPASSQPKDPGLTQAVADIEIGFRTGDIAQVEKHVLADEKLTVRSAGHAEQSMDGGAYLDRTRDAFKEMKTVRYELDRFSPAGEGAWKVEGTHVLRRDDGTERRYHVHFLLKRHGDMWMIAEVGADPA